MKRAKPLRFARFHRRRKGRPVRRLIIGIGQVHAVGHGRFERFEARNIAKVQYWLFQACMWFTSQGVTAFGQEGLGNGTGKAVYGRLPPDLLAELMEDIRDPKGVRRYLRKTAHKWRKALRRKETAEVSRTLKGLDALNILQAVEKGVAVFPIEQPEIHGPLGEEIRKLHRKIETIEGKPSYRSVVSKKGKGLTEEEYTLAVERHELVEAYNALLRDEGREEAIAEEVLLHSQESDVTVFILGQGHRDSMLSLLPSRMPSGTLFLWITPPLLWLPAALTKVTLLGIALGIALTLFLTV